MNLLKKLLTIGLLVAVVACGGGGGSAGSSGTGSGSTGSTGSTGSGSSGTTASTAVATPTVVVTVVDSAGAPVSGNNIAGSLKRLKIKVTSSTGAPVPMVLVTFGADSNFAVMTPASGSVLTDANGEAYVVVKPASLSVVGASLVTANVQIQGTSFNYQMPVQASSSNVTFGTLNPTLLSLTAYQSTAVEVPVFVDGLAASAGQVIVNFSSPCGVFNPSSVPSGSNGTAQSTFTATGCGGGGVVLTAGATGVSAAASRQVTVLPPTASNIQFVSAIPQTIYSQQALFGDKLSSVKFRLVDSGGNGIDGQSINLRISGPALAAGVTFSDTGLTTSSQATSGGGYITLNVRSGDIPTPVTFIAELATNANISSSSGGLVVNSGAPAQNFFSISVETPNIEGWSYDGESTGVILYVADRLAQPVPNGTVISFVAEGGQITGSCATVVDTNGKSRCSVSLISQDFRPTNGRVTVLAYAEGLEPFQDDNGNNIYDGIEVFGDLGQPFIDKNENGVYDADEQKIGNANSPGLGTSACAPIDSRFGTRALSVPNTCSGTHGKALVRDNAVIVFSTSTPKLPTVTFRTVPSSTPSIRTITSAGLELPTTFTDGTTSRTITSARLDLELSDRNGNAMPYNTKLEATISGGTSCSIDKISPNTVLATTLPTIHSILLKTGENGNCYDAQINVSVKTPKNNETALPTYVIK